MFTIVGGELVYEGDDPTSVEEALDISIAKWEYIVEHYYEFDTDRYDGSFQDGGPDTCGLCMMFFYDRDCDGCPVMEATGKPCCYDTPYNEHADATYEKELTEETRRIARKELDFLKSLKNKYG